MNVNIVTVLLLLIAITVVAIIIITITITIIIMAIIIIIIILRVNMWGSKFGKELWESLTVATRRDTIQQVSFLITIWSGRTCFGIKREKGRQKYASAHEQPIVPS